MFAQLDGFEWTRFTAYTDVQNTSPTLTNPFFSGDLSKSDVKWGGVTKASTREHALPPADIFAVFPTSALTLRLISVRYQ